MHETPHATAMHMKLRGDEDLFAGDARVPVGNLKLVATGMSPRDRRRRARLSTPPENIPTSVYLPANLDRPQVA